MKVMSGKRYVANPRELSIEVGHALSNACITATPLNINNSSPLQLPCGSQSEVSTREQKVQANRIQHKQYKKGTGETSKHENYIQKVAYRGFS